MIKLKAREMKNLSRILSMMLCFAPLCVNAAGTVATTSGSNLTAFNPSNAYNNQWASLSNGRYDANAASAKVDFGNCNAVVLRCAQPKCSNGGCADSSVASAIVAGCVQSNENCKQYGNDLVQYMTAQLVASSNAKINEQNAAAQQAAAAAAAQQSQQQMAAMQQQMQQMQYQMQQQQEQSAQQLQNALAQQAAQNAAALESVKSAATDAAKENEAGISAYQQDAINRGVSADVIERQKITGQVMTELENAEVQLKELKTVMNTAFEYAGCDPRGNNCTGPKRVKKWRELAREFTEPYNNSIQKVYEALTIAQNVGVDLSQIYMMLSDSCNSWGQYMCPQTSNGQIAYFDVSSGQRGTPYVCPVQKSGDNIVWDYTTCRTQCNIDNSSDADRKKCYVTDCLARCTSCTLLKTLTDGEDVYNGWINADSDTTNGNTTVVACASGVLDSSKFFAPITRRKNGANLVDMDMLELWLDQIGIDKKYNYNSMQPEDYCFCTSCTNNGAMEDILRKSTLSRSVDTSRMYCKKIDTGGLCSTTTADNADAAYINPIYAICDTHPYNAGKGADLTASFRDMTSDEFSKYCNSELKTLKEEYATSMKDIVNCSTNKIKAVDTAEMKEIIALKTTVISQQMYKQYEYLSATLRRLKTQLEKATLTATLQAAGAKDDESSSSGLLGGGSSKTSQYRNCTGKNKQGTLDCLRENYSLLDNQSRNKKCDKGMRDQLSTDVKIMRTLKALTETDCPDSGKCSECLIQYNSGLMNLETQILNEEAMRQGKYYSEQ